MTDIIHASIKTSLTLTLSAARLAITRRLLILRQQTPQTKIVHHILDLLDAVLNPVTALPQRVVLEVEDLEAGVHVFDELRDLQRAAVVA